MEQAILSLVLVFGSLGALLPESSGHSITFWTRRELPDQHRFRKRNNDETAEIPAPQSGTEVVGDGPIRLFSNFANWDAYHKHVKDETDRLMSKYGLNNGERTTEKPYWIVTTESPAYWENEEHMFREGRHNQQQTLWAILGVVAGIIIVVGIYCVACCSTTGKNVCRNRPEANLAAQQARLRIHPPPVVVYPSRTRHQYPRTPVPQPVVDNSVPASRPPINLSHEDSLPIYTEATRNSPALARTN